MTITKVSLLQKTGHIKLFSPQLVTYFKIQMGLKNGPWIFLTAERVEKAVGDSVTVSCSSTSRVSSG